MQLNRIRPKHQIRGAADGDGVVGEVVIYDEKENSEKIQIEPEVGEIRQPRVARVHHTSTKAEWDAHMLLHADYRSWYSFCAGGKAHSAHHVMSHEEERFGMNIRMGYTFIGNCRGRGEVDWGSAFVDA